MAYAERLESAWLDHLVPRSIDAPTVVSTFAGCGGSSLGYSMAGFEERLVVEWNEKQAASFVANFPDVPLHLGDIADLSDADALRLSRLAPGELDVFDGSPPCQGFSLAGGRVFEDKRNQLFLEYVRLLKAFAPKAFVMENVRGMVIGKMRLIFADILRELKATGYQVSARVLIASHYGVPQARPRMIFVGIRNDLAALGVVPSHPQPLFARGVTVREAWHGVINEPEELNVARFGTGRLVHRILYRMSPGEYADKYHPNRQLYGMHRLDFDQVSPTILRNGGAGGVCEACHPSEHRRATIAELKRLGSFPDSFVLRGSFQDRWAAIGNSVPPLFMRAIAAHVRQLLATVEERHVESA
ncbi:DNA (cytosine-5)-methyltransferase 1 [Paraburkholderia sp. CI2]|uniref:DNA cytosine methyltransferase n=1 Tax=Paraburkholderia sp. CI2 TaxID=2723093 RepID=UPI0016114E1F|nr:DNA cytosine methyltransferase [Paraburkholderia sp. CI2]MBB5469361.1 DNA (cytosine-5)-methyltransferase 1 [Paraburkholderia sp. CI2]